MFWFTAVWAAPLQLDGGVRLVLQPDPQSPTVTAAMIFEAGRIDDPAGQEGTAHVLEHLWFESAAPGGVTSWHALRAAGCEAYAYTYDDHMIFITRCPADQRGLLLERELSRLADPLAGVDEAAVARALAVVGHEEHERASVPFVQVLPQLYAALYPESHPVVARDARPEVAALQLDPMRTWAAEWLAPSRATVAWSGAFDGAEVQRAFEQAHGAPTASVTPMPRRTVPSPRRTLRPAPRTLSLPLRHGGLALGWAPPPREMDGLTAEILAEMVSRALYVRWLGDARVLGVGCSPQQDGMGTPVLCWVETAQDAPLDALASEMRAVTDGLWSGAHRKFIQKRFRAARSQAEIAARGWPDGWGSAADSWTATLAWSVHRRGVDPLADDLDSLRKLKAGHLLEQASEFLSPGQAAILIVQPLPAGEPSGEFVSPTPPANQPEPSSSQAIAAKGALDVAERTLPNGTRVLALHRPDAQLVYGAVRVLDQGDPRVKLVEYASTREPSTDLLRDVAEPLAGDGVTVLAGSELDQVLDALRSQVRGGELSPLMITTAMLKGQARTRWLSQQPDYWASVLPLVATDPSGETARRALGGQWAPMKLDELVTIHVALQNPAHTQVIVLGSQPAEALLEAAARAFEGPAGQIALPAPPAQPPAPWTGAEVALVDDPGVSTATLVAVCPLPAGDPLAQELAAQALWERLWVTLREQQSLLYTPSVRPGPEDRLTVRLQTPWSSASDALLQLRDALLAIEGGQAGPELAWARQQMLLSSPSLADPVDTLQFALGAEQIRTAAEIEGHLERLAALDAAALGQALAGCWENVSVGVSGPQELLAAELGAWPVDLWTPQTAQQAVQATLERRAGTE